MRALLPDTLAGAVRGKIDAAPNISLVRVTYGVDGSPYSIFVRIATGEAMKQVKANLNDELNEPDTDLQGTRYKGKKLWFRDEESAVSYYDFTDKVAIIIAADAPANTSFDKEAARKHLLEALEKLHANI